MITKSGFSPARTDISLYYHSRTDSNANPIIYRIYSSISRKIYDKILTKKFGGRGGDLYAGHKIKNFFVADEIRSFRRVAPRDSVLLCGVHCRIVGLQSVA